MERWSLKNFHDGPPSKCIFCLHAGNYTHRCPISVSIDDWALTLVRPLATIVPIASPGPLGESSYCDNVYLLVFGEKGIPGGGNRDRPAVPRWTVAGDWVVGGSGSRDIGDSALVVDIFAAPFPCSMGLYETGTESSGYPVMFDTSCTD